MEARATKQQMELLWRGTGSFGPASDLLTGNFLSGNYGPPPGFNWDWGQTDPQMQVLLCIQGLGLSCHLHCVCCHPVYKTLGVSYIVLWNEHSMVGYRDKGMR